MAGGPRQHRGLRAADDRGASAVEFALITPIFVVIVMGILEFGMILYAYNSAQDSARDIVRRIALNTLATGDALKTAKGEMPGWITSDVTATVTQTTPGTPATNLVTVDVGFPAAKAAPSGFFSALWGTSVLHGTATMKQEMPQ